MVSQWQINTLKEDEHIVIRDKVSFAEKLKRKLFGNRIFVKVPNDDGTVSTYDAEDVFIIKRKDARTLEFSCKVYYKNEWHDGKVFTNSFNTMFSIPEKNINITVTTPLIKELHQYILENEKEDYLEEENFRR